jgi:NADP-dependent 3-hydroxy acid dehydrogenase YdfG/aryl carrier-like protein
MQKGQHIGKIVISIDQKTDPLPVTATAQQLRLNPDKSYLLVGGLGGLGRAISTWLVEHGARHLIYLSRSAGKSDRDRDFFCELQCQGCSSQIIVGSVTKIEDIQGAVKSASKPIAGVLQLSMVLRDGPFQNMTIEDWNTAVAPKVEGTWNLHNTIPKDLDFFISSGSVSGTFGNAHQANYAAANAFLDAFVQYRHSQGLAASVLDIGVVADIGYVSRNATIKASLRARGVYWLQEQDILDSLHWAILHSHQSSQRDCGFDSTSQLALGISMDSIQADSSSRNPWKRDARLGIYHNIDTTASSKNSNSSDQIKSFILSVESNPAVLDSRGSLDLLTREIGIIIYTFMLQPIEDLDVTQPLATLGVDSLVTIEIRNWMRRNLAGVEFSTLEIQNARTIEGLGAVAIQGLKAKFENRVTDETYMAMKAP